MRISCSERTSTSFRSGRPRTVRRAAPGVALAISLVACSTSTVPGSAPVRPGPAHLVGYDSKLHRIDVFDAHFKVVRHFAAPALPSPFPQVGPSGTFVFSSTGGDAVVDLRSGRTVRFTLPGTDEAQQYAPTDAKVLTFTDVDGRVSVLNVASGKVTDGRTLIRQPDARFLGNGIAFPDAITFAALDNVQNTTLVVPFDGSAAYPVPGRVLSVDGDTALTADETSVHTTRIALWQHRSNRGSVTVASDVAGGLLTGSTTATLFTDDGRVLAIDLEHHTTRSLADLGGSGQFAVTISADRVLVGNPDDGTPSRLVDAHGHVVATFAPIGGHAVWLGPGYRPIGSACFITQTTTKFVSRGGNVSLRDAETGRVRARLSGTAVLARTPDGCSAITSVSVHPQAALDGTLHSFPGVSAIQAIAPDLRHVVASGRPASHDASGFAVVDVRSDRHWPVPAGIYAWVSDAPS